MPNDESSRIAAARRADYKQSATLSFAASCVRPLHFAFSDWILLLRAASRRSNSGGATTLWSGNFRVGRLGSAGAAED